MNDDFAAERFNVPKVEALDWLRGASLTSGVLWWFSGNGTRSPAAPRTSAGQAAARVLAPTLADLDAALRSAGLVSCSNMSPVPAGRGQRIAWLKATLGDFSPVDVIFVDLDTGIGHSSKPAHIGPDEVAEIAKLHHAMIYQHCGRETAGETANRVRKMLVGLVGVECWYRPPTTCVVVWVPRQPPSTGSPTIAGFRPQPTWRAVQEHPS